MSTLPQKYEEVAKSLIPYVSEQTETHQMALISVEPALPCFLCGRPATKALAAPAKHVQHQTVSPWLTFPICPNCEATQIGSQPGHAA